MKKSLFILAVAAMLTALAASAFAEGYKQGTVTVAPQASGYASLNNNASSFFTYGLDLGIFALDTLEVGARGQGMFMTSKYSDPLWGTTTYTFNGIGTEGYLRWFFMQFDKNNALFATVSAGGMWVTDVGKPMWSAGGYFTGTAGLGFNAALNQYLNFQICANYRHIGNFNANGVDGLGGTVALQVNF